MDNGADAILSDLSFFPHAFLAQRLEFYYMINYYYKYLELIDTVFLALKKKPLRPLSLNSILGFF